MRGKVLFMKRITDHLSKEIVIISEGEIAGIVTNAYVKEKLGRVIGWRVSSEEKEEESLVPLGRIVGFADALTVQNASAVKPSPYMPCPLGAKMYDSAGRFIGVFRDLCFDEKTGRTLSVLSDEKEFDPSLVVGVSAKAVVFRAEEHAEKRFAKAPRNKVGQAEKRTRRKINENALSLFSEGERQAEEQATPQEEIIETQEATEINRTEIESSALSEESEKTEFLGDYGFLLGRTVLKDVLSGGAVIAKKGSEVSAEIVEEARAKGKLVELTVNSKRA